ncbi:PAS domain S-box protein [Halovenus rubra]|uniref:PAS domain S-box protein n=2 Tax=Halovenus rubra TaxID=869890 RepID=A0ACC7E550_9EURY|nr:PAS domain S-box protein [Halovenus rubra]
MPSTLKTIQVLHVDDDPSLTDLTATILEEKNEAFDLETASSVCEAERYLNREHVDCIVSDYEMPGQNGIEFLETVRESFPDLPFILYTGKGSEEIASDAISAGVTDYLQKGSGTGQYTVLANRIRNAVEAYRSTELLSERTRRLETLIRNLPGIVYRCLNEPDWPMETVRGDAESLVGYSAQALEENNVNWGQDILHPDDQTEIWETVQECLSEDGTFEVTYRIVTKDGETKWMWEQGRGIYHNDGTIEALEGFITDITDRKRRENKLTQTRSRLKALSEGSPDMINIHDSEGNIIDPNPQLCEQTGYDESELTEMAVWDLDETVDPEQAKAFWEQIDTGNSRRVQGRFRRKDGSTFPVETHVKRTDIDGEDRFVVTSRNITERVEDKRKLERYSNTLERLQRTTQQLMETTDTGEATDIVLQSLEDVLDFDIVAVWEANDARTRLEPVGQSERGAELIPEMPSYSPGNSLSWEAFAEGEMYVIDDLSDYEKRYNPDTVLKSELLVPFGEYGLLNIGSTETTDFSERDIAHVELWAETIAIAFDRIERERALRERENELVRQRDRLDEFASIVSHDLRNPLNVAELRLDLARDENDNDHLEAVASAHERMSVLVDDLLTLARYGETLDSTKPVSVADLVDNCWKNVNTAHADICIDSDITVKADQNRLQQLVENLIRNAIDHGSITPSVDTVEQCADNSSIEANERADTTGELVVTVGDLSDGFYIEDNGPGIPSEKREDVFETGFSTADGGTGFGLSIVQQVIEAHSWSIDVTESAAGGARFEITQVDIADR